MNGAPAPKSKLVTLGLYRRGTRNQIISRLYRKMMHNIDAIDRAWQMSCQEALKHRLRQAAKTEFKKTIPAWEFSCA